MKADYWLSKFLDAIGIRTRNDLSGFNFSDEILADMRSMAMRWTHDYRPDETAGETLLAGNGLDLSGGFSCPNPDCRKKQVDHLFRHTWHYFDTILLPDSAGTLILSADLDNQRESIISRLSDHISTYLMLKESGVVDMVRFFAPIIIQEDWRTCAKNNGYGKLVEIEESLIDSFSNRLNYIQERDGENITIRVPYNYFGVDILFTDLEVGLFTAISEKQQKHDIAEYLIDDSMLYLLRDLINSNRHNVPLGNTIPAHQATLDMLQTKTNSASVAMNIELPILRGISLNKLIELRRQEFDSFQRVRVAIKVAAQERLKNINSPSAAEVAKEIENDILVPAISEISQRLKAASSAMKRELTLGISLGALTTICGVLSGVGPPLAGGAGIAASIAAASRAGTRRINEIQNVESSSYYFIWKAMHSH